ncbi:FecR domain-containing protein [Porticoccaceae bacterium LTM1]|nr:FecR domain-containing protein [Porticoccaceae bacterium LTM1]
MKTLKRLKEKMSAATDLAKLYSEEPSVSPSESWRNKSSEYQQQFLTSVELMADLEALADDPEILAAAGENSGKVTRLERAAERWPVWAMAATVMLAVAVSFNVWMPVDEGAKENIEVLRYVTRVGEQKQVNLTDGSVINLNTGTQLLVELSGNQRKVTLQRGEAFFDVAKDANRPFVVDLGATAVTALGTAFDIRKEPDSFRLAVLDGVVAIHSNTDTAKGDEPLLDVSAGQDKTASAKSAYRATAGTVVNYSHAKQRMVAHYDSKISRFQQWRSGQLRFEDVPLYQVVKELNRYSGKKILIEDDRIMNMKIFALVNLKQLDSALLGLETTMPIKVTKHFDRIVIVGTDK